MSITGFPGLWGVPIRIKLNSYWQMVLFRIWWGFILWFGVLFAAGNHAGGMPGLQFVEDFATVSIGGPALSILISRFFFASFMKDERPRTLPRQNFLGPVYGWRSAPGEKLGIGFQYFCGTVLAYGIFYILA